MLKQRYINTISNDQILFGKIASVADKKPSSILYWIRKKQYDKFCTFPILEVIREHVGAKNVNELVEQTASV